MTIQKIPSLRDTEMLSIRVSIAELFLFLERILFGEECFLYRIFQFSLLEKETRNNLFLANLLRHIVLEIWN